MFTPGNRKAVVGVDFGEAGEVTAPAFRKNPRHGE